MSRKAHYEQKKLALQGLAEHYVETSPALALHVLNAQALSDIYNVKSLTTDRGVEFTNIRPDGATLVGVLLQQYYNVDNIVGVDSSGNFAETISVGNIINTARKGFMERVSETIDLSVPTSEESIFSPLSTKVSELPILSNHVIPMYEEPSISELENDLMYKRERYAEQIKLGDMWEAVEVLYDADVVSFKIWLLDEAEKINEYNTTLGGAFSIGTTFYDIFWDLTLEALDSLEEIPEEQPVQAARLWRKRLLWVAGLEKSGELLDLLNDNVQ